MNQKMWIQATSHYVSSSGKKFRMKWHSEGHFLLLPCLMHISDVTCMTGMEPNQQRCQVKSGIRVKIVLKQDQRSGKLTEGVVKDILTNSSTHPHGIKVRLTDGKVGRVQTILK